MSDRILKVWGDSGVFSIKLPDDAKVTFGPWAPPNARMIEGGLISKGSSFGPERGGTLRIYKGTKTTGDVLAVFAGVQGFRDTSLEYEEEPTPMPEPMVLPRPLWISMDEHEREELATLVARVIAGNAMEDAMKEKDEEPPGLPF